MTTRSQFMKTIEMPGQFDPMSQSRCRLGRLVDGRRALALPLPTAVAVECFRENVLALSIHIDAHLAWPSGAISSVRRKVRIDNVQVHRNGLHRFDGLPATHRFGIA